MNVFSMLLCIVHTVRPVPSSHYRDNLIITHLLPYLTMFAYCTARHAALVSSVRRFSASSVGEKVTMRRIKSAESDHRQPQLTTPSSTTANLIATADSKCGPPQEAVDEKISIQNDQTGEILGPPGREPTRFGDWERKGKCVDF